MLTPSKRLCDVALDRLRRLDPEHVEDGRDDVDRVVVLLAHSPRAVVPAGQQMMHGSQVPPLNSYRFHILNGVLNAIAQPLG